jgi:hypothetical protein
MRNQYLSWEIRKKGDETLVIFSGEVDESTDFAPLESLTGIVTFDLAGIRRLNSEGIRKWTLFIQSLGSVTKLVLVRCSVPMVNQLNMIRGLHGNAEVRSFYAPYICERTGEEKRLLLTREDVPNPLNPPTFPCEGGEMQLDEIAERYFAFLMDRKS